MEEDDALLEKTRSLAALLFPGEEWVQIEPRIWVAKSRLSERDREKDKWEKEMSQVRILTSLGSAAYFLPECSAARRARSSPQNKGIETESGQTCADLILNGVILEMKTTDGTRSTVGSLFRYGYNQGRSLARRCPNEVEHSVFIRLLSGLTEVSVKAKIAGELKNRLDNGSFFCFFEKTGELLTWSYKELRAFIRPGKK